MELRIRCPQCQTVLKVKPGTRPTCPGCGFAGAGSPDPEQHQPVEFTATDAPVEFTATSEPVKFSRAEPQAQGWGAEPGADPGWQPVEGGQPGEAWEDTSDGRQTPPSAAPQQPPEAPKRKRGLFGRR